MGGRGSSSGSKGGGGAYKTDENGVRVYSDTDEGIKAFYALDKNYIRLNKIANIRKDEWAEPQMVKKSQMWDFLSNNNINGFRLVLDKGAEKRTLQQLEKNGFSVVAKPEWNNDVTKKWDTIQYVVKKKKR